MFYCADPIETQAISEGQQNRADFTLLDIEKSYCNVKAGSNLQ